LDAPAGDVDLLVDPHDLERLRRAMAVGGFVSWRAWGSAGQHSFVGSDGEGGWLSLHVTDRLWFGRAHALATDAASGCLARRHRQDGVWVLDGDDELWVTVLHGLLDKGHVAAKHRSRLRELAASSQAGPSGPVPRALAQAVGTSAPFDPVALLAAISADRWSDAEQAGTVLSDRWSAQPLARLRTARNLAALAVLRLVEPLTAPGACVALLAPDGAGKSTLAAALRESFHVPAHVEYLGLYGASSPLAGRRTVRGVGFLARLGWLLRARIVTRWYRSRRWMVVLDRHPYDVLAMPPSRRRGERLRRWALSRAGPRPDLTVVLDAPGSVLHARKGEHDVAHLEQRRAEYLRLARSLDHASVIDATAAPEVVRRAAVAAVWKRYREQRTS
jgi:thymidylate kinase